MGPGSGGLLLLCVVTVAAGSSGGPVSLTSSSPLAEPQHAVSSGPPSREAGPEEELGPGSELICWGASASGAPWWPHGEQDGSRERLLVSKLGLEEEAGPEGGQVRSHDMRPRPQTAKIKAFFGFHEIYTPHLSLPTNTEISLKSQCVVCLLWAPVGASSVDVTQRVVASD